MAQYDQSKSMVEIAEDYIRKNGKQNIYKLMEVVAEIKGFSKEEEDKKTLLFIDITMSGNFVYCGNEEWDLKENNLELWDKDGSYFNKDDYIDEDEEDDIKLEDYLVPEEIDIKLTKDEDEEEVDEDEEEEVIIEDDDIPVYSTDDDDDVEVDLDFDDEDYHDIMDDYEDMYED